MRAGPPPPRARALYEGVLGLKVDQDFPGEKLRLRIGKTDRLALRPPLPGTPSRRPVQRAEDRA